MFHRSHVSPASTRTGGNTGKGGNPPPFFRRVGFVNDIKRIGERFG
jgi:hypothetical protein